MNIYALYDTVSKEFAPVFEQNTPEAAKRALRGVPEILAKLDDLTIVCVGELHPATKLPANEPYVSGYDTDFEGFIPLREFLELDEKVSTNE